jgi:aflatoxin B1 aldehyde reductase
MTLPRLYLGTMTFGWAQASLVCDLPVATEFLSKFSAFIEDNALAQPLILDTARVYAGGDTEPIVGDAIAVHQAPPAVYLSTKAHPSQPHGLSKQGITQQLRASLAALKVKSVDEFYIHQPDTNFPLLESLQCLHQFVLEGTIKRIGMSK